jgi:flagellar basal body L-ring protein FlgH
MKSQQTILLALAVAAAYLISGCSMTDRFREDQGREFDATWPEVADATQREPGSLYAQGTDVSLWSNVTARNLGDTLTVVLA